MTAQLASVPTDQVQVVGGVVHIRNLATSDPDLVALLTDSTDPVDLILRVLGIGARALEVSRTGVDTAVIEKSFGTLLDQLAQLMQNTSNQVTDGTTKLLNDPKTGLHVSLDHWKRDVSEFLTALFDPDRASSAIGKFEAVMDGANDRQLVATKRLLSADNEDSPLYRLFTGLQQQINSVIDAVARVAEQVAADKAATAATAAALERSAVKGIAYEEQVVEAVTSLAAHWGDITHPVGRQSGTKGGLVGDVVVELDQSEETALPGRYVLEVKNRRLTLSATLTELRQAAANREAEAAIAVFASESQAPTAEPFAVFDNLAVVVYDRDTGDTAALRLACAWARYMVRRRQTKESGGVDADYVGNLIGDARRALDKCTNIRRAHSAAARKIQEAGGQVNDLSSEMTEIFSKIDNALQTVHN